MSDKMKGITCCGDCGYYNWKKHKCTRCNNIEPEDAREKFFQDCPLKDVSILNHGQWSINDDMWGEPYSIRCSECGEEFVAYEQTLEELANDYKYCPQCGTRNVLSLETETSDNGEDDEND